MVIKTWKTHPLEIIHLIDYDIPQWSEGHKTPKELNEIVEKADAFFRKDLHCTIWM